MITRCNQCGTKFEISAELVQSDDPSVRCGECLSVFDARAQLIGGDSIQNYTSVSAGRQAGRRHARRKAVAPAAATVAEPTHAEAAGTADHYAHISDDDLENAATVVLDQNLSDNQIPASAHRTTATSDRINDGFYSPDIGIGPMDDQHLEAESGGPGKAVTKIDPSISVGGYLDSTSLEFERTLAFENYSQAEVDAQTTINDQNEGIADGLGSLKNSQFDTRLAAPASNTNLNDQTLPLTQDFDTGVKWQPEPHPLSDRDKRSAGDPTAAALTGRDYPQVDEDLLANQSDAFEQLSGTADPDRHLSPEELGIQPRVDTAEFNQQNDALQEFEKDQSSASELRRYVSTGGGAIVSGSDTGQRRKTRQSTSMLKPLLLVCVLAAGALYLARDTIATMNLPEPVVSVFCGIAGCELPLQKDVEQLELVRHQMASHKTLDNVLVFTVDLINRANFPQPYPALVVTMANSGGESVAFRKFQPSEYLEEDPALTRLPAGMPVRIKFEIVDPGPEALSSELSFE